MCENADDCQEAGTREPVVVPPPHLHKCVTEGAAGHDVDRAQGGEGKGENTPTRASVMADGDAARTIRSRQRAHDNGQRRSTCVMRALTDLWVLNIKIKIINTYGIRYKYIGMSELTRYGYLSISV
jgi:hypothetical protein